MCFPRIPTSTSMVPTFLSVSHSILSDRPFIVSKGAPSPEMKFSDSVVDTTRGGGSWCPPSGVLTPHPVPTERGPSLGMGGSRGGRLGSPSLTKESTKGRSTDHRRPGEGTKMWGLVTLYYTPDLSTVESPKDGVP